MTGRQEIEYLREFVWGAFRLRKITQDDALEALHLLKQAEEALSKGREDEALRRYAKASYIAHGNGVEMT